MFVIDSTTDHGCPGDKPFVFLYPLKGMMFSNTPTWQLYQYIFPQAELTTNGSFLSD